MAKVLRGARSGAPSQPLMPAIFRRKAQEGVSQGSSPAAPAAGMGRLMHTGQWNSVSASTKLPFGGRVDLSQRQKIMKMEQLSSRRTYMSDNGPDTLPWDALAILFGMYVGFSLPTNVRYIWERIKEE